MKELGRGYKPGSSNAKGKDKNSYSFTSTGKMPFRAGQYKMTIEEIKKVTRCGNCHKVGYWHRECPEPPRKKEQNFLETEEAVFCGLLEADGPPPEESGQGLHEADGPPAEQPELSLPRLMDYSLKNLNWASLKQMDYSLKNLNWVSRPTTAL